MENDEIELTEEQETPTQEQQTIEKKPEESAPLWATEMASAMRGIADRVTREPQKEAPKLTPEQLKAINDKLTAGIVSGDPLSVLAPLADEVSRENLGKFRQELQPYVQAAVDSFVDRYKSEKKEDASDKGQTALYKQVAKQFAKELEDEDLTALVQKTPAQRTKFLDKAWRAAQGEVLASRVAVKGSARPEGASGSAGSGGGGTGARRSDKPTLSESEKRQLYRALGKEKGDAAIKEIEDNLVGSEA